MISALIIEVLEMEKEEGRRYTCADLSTRVLEEFIRRMDYKDVKEDTVEKERRTIKRRVYDSINVLIALGKIKKEKKWLSVPPSSTAIDLELIKAKQ
jgi:hypothetical protein